MWEIKGKNDVVKAIPSTKPEYNGEWMGESYVTINVESPTPVNFEIGDYLIYRGERFEINYDPGKIKSAPPETKGDAFKYENIKFNSLADELTRCDFLDVVLEDNQLHFTGLPKFSFYGGVRDLANRIQANLDRAYPNQWTVIVSPEYSDTKEVNISVDTIKVQGALSILVNDLKAYYTIKGRTITIGAAGIPAGHLFKYGKGNGLYEIEQNAEADQAIVTRLRAYGSSRNLPHRYYHNLPNIDRAHADIHAVISKAQLNNGAVDCVATFAFLDSYIDTQKCFKFTNANNESYYWLTVTINGKSYAASVDTLKSPQQIVIGYRPPKGYSGSANWVLRRTDMNDINAGTSVAFDCYKSTAPGIVEGQHVPNNMSVNFLMLPGFPETTLDPYIDSANIDALGVREGTIFFDGSQEGLEEIYPSIEGMTAEQLIAAGVPCNATGRLDEIVSAEQMTDNGIGKIEGDKTEAEPATFKVTLKDLGFNINDHLTTETATVSFKTGMLGGRDFEIVGCVEIKDSSDKVTGYEVELNRVYDDDIKLWFPYSAYNAKPGDKFVLLHIEMPEVYIKAASQRLLEAATAWLAKNDYSRSVYAPKVDEIFMARQHDEAMASGGTIASLHDTLKEGMMLLFEDEDLNIDASIFIDRLTIKEEGKIPTYEIVLKEEKTVGRLDKMQNQIDSLASGGQGAGYTAAQYRQMIDAYGSSRFLSKLKDDRAKGKIASDLGFEIGNYLAGVSGGMLGIDKTDGSSFADVFKLWVRGKAYFETLTIIEAATLAGKKYITPGGAIKCTKVEEVKNDAGAVSAYRCYFLSEQDGEKTETKIVAGDQAISEMFNAKTGTTNKITNHRYWRLVTAVNNDAYSDDADNHYGYIDLSAADCETGSDIPKEGDVIDQLGSRNDATRQSAMVFSTVDPDSPSIKMFAGIGYGTTNAEYYSLNNKAIISLWRDATTGKACFRLGATDATQFLDYKQDEGLTLNGKLSVGSTIGDKTLNQYFLDLIPDLTQEDIEDFVNNIVDPKIEGIQNQIDGVIETWFFNGVPTLTNYPASDWNTEALKIAHLGDLYYDNDTGTAYRFSQNTDESFYWNVITDDAITKALAAAKKAQDTADGKRRVFTAQPTPPYDKGDLWVNATYPAGTTAATRDPAQGKYYNDILRCGTSRATGAFAIGDWGLSSNYTDDTLAQAAKDAADKAQADADKAKADAKAAKDRLDQWAADGVISPTEKQAIKDEIARIDADKAHITAEYTRYGLGTPTAYNNAHATYRTQLVALSATTPENITIPSNFASNQTAYYNARTAALNAIANAAKKYAENIAKQEAEKAVAGYKYLKEALGDVTTIAGGLMLSSQIRLGQHNADFTTQTTWAGHNGVYDNGRTIGSWWGGDMIDRFDANDNRLNVAGKRYATSLIRMDGTGYFVDGLFRIKKTGLEIGDTANGYGISMGMDGRLTLGNGIDINIGGNAQGLAQSISSVTNLANKLADLFTPYIGTSPKNWGEITDISKITSVKVNAGIWTDGFVSARGLNGNGGSGSGGAGKSYLSDLLDVDLGTLTSGQVLTWNGTKWVNSALTLPDMAGYALESWVEANYYTKTEVNAKNYIKVIECFKTTEWSDIRCVSDPMTMRAFDVYGTEAGGPTMFGNVLEITGRYNHWQPQLWFDADKGGSILHRNKTYNNNTWGEWHKLLDTHNYASVLDTAYVKKSGDTMSGMLTVSANRTMLLALYGSTDGSYIQFGHGGVGAEIGCYNGLGAYFQNDALASRPTLCLDTNDINSAKFRYNGTKYNLWHAGNDGSGSGLDADLLDGRHREEILRVGRMPATATSLNNRVVSEGIDFFSWNYATAPNVNGQPSGDGAASAASVVTFGVEYPFQICSDYYNTDLLYYRSLYNGWKAWRRFAFVDSNVASATKLQTARTLWGQSFNGTANVSGSITGVSNIIADYYYLANGSTNPYLRLTLNSHNWYVQAYIDKLFVGAGIDTSMQIDINGNVGIGLAYSAAPSAKLDVAGLVKASSGIQIGGTADYGWYLNSSRLVAGGGVARGVNVGSLLVSDKWADATKVPTNGIYSKGAVRIGDCTISWDSANNMLKFDKGLYSEGGVTAHGINANSGGSGGGGKNYLSDLLDVQLGTPAAGHALVYRNNKWVNEAIAFPSLAGYALESWVEGNFLSVDELEEGGEIAETYLQKDGSNAANSCLSNLQRKLPATPKTPAGTDLMLFFDGGNGYSTSVDNIWQYVKTKTDRLYLGPDGDGATEFTLYNMMSACFAGSSIVDNDRFFAASWEEAEGVSYSASDFWTYIKSKMGLAFTVDGDNVSIGCQPGTLTLNGVKITSGSVITCNSLSAQGVTAYDVTIGGPSVNCVHIKYQGKTYTLQLAKLIQAGYLTA